MVVLMTEAEPPGAAEPPTRCETQRSREESEVDSGVLGAPGRRSQSPGAPQPDLQEDPLERSQRRTGTTGPTGTTGTTGSTGTTGTRRPVEFLSPMSSLSDVETKQEKKKPGSSQISKSNNQFHKLFKEVKRDEFLRQSFPCALQREMLYQGRLYVSENWICFHSRVFGRDTKISIPVSSVTFLKKTKTALLVPNALLVQTSTHQHVFVSFLSRNTTFKLLKSLCLPLEEEKSCSLQTSSCRSSFTVDSPSTLPLDPGSGFSGLDQVDQHRRDDLMESSSSGSQTPDSDRTTDLRPFLSPLRGGGRGGRGGELSVHADVHLQSAAGRHSAAMTNVSAQWMDGSFPAGSLLLLYLLLVLVLLSSSCFLSFKIVSLEQRLNSLLSAARGNLQNQNVEGQRSPEEVKAELHRELSSNLLRLEKIQRNLRKLLNET